MSGAARMARGIVVLGLVLGGCGTGGGGGGGSAAPLASSSCLTLDPTIGPVSGDRAVWITTSGFTDDFYVDLPTVLFDTAAATLVVPTSQTSLVAWTPPDPNPDPTGAPRAVDVTVISTGVVESCVFPQGYVYVTRTGQCMLITPDTGRSGTSITIDSLGQCLWELDTTVTIGMGGGVEANNVVIVDPYTLTCTAPDVPAQNLGPVDVEVTGKTPAGDICVCLLPGGFTYQ